MAESATVYTISPSEDSALSIEVLKTGLISRKRKYRLFFEDFAGELHLVENDPSASTIQLSINTASAVCRDASLSEKKKRSITDYVRKQALAAHTYPAIRFASTRIRPKALRGFVVSGMLQVREKTRELTVSMAFNPVRKHEFQLDGDATLRLSDFGLPRPSAILGLLGTADEVMVHLLLWAVPISRK